MSKKQKAIGCTCSLDCTLELGTCVCVCHKLEEINCIQKNEDSFQKVVLGFDNVFDAIKEKSEIEVYFVKNLFIHSDCFLNFIEYLKEKNYRAEKGVFKYEAPEPT